MPVGYTRSDSIYVLSKESWNDQRKIYQFKYEPCSVRIIFTNYKLKIGVESVLNIPGVRFPNVGITFWTEAATS